MIITCENCNTRYSVNKQALGKSGKKVKCSNCEYEWFQESDIIKEGLQNKYLQKEETFPNDKKDIDTRQLFSSDVIKKKKNYRFLYLFIFIILILFIYLNKEHFNYGIKDFFFKLIKKELLINKLEENSFNLVFSQIEKEISILNNNQRIVRIFGKISNASNEKKYQIPKLQATLLDSKNNIITSWFFYAEQDNLDPQESLNFNTSYIHDSEDIADIKIEFYKEGE